MFLRKVTILEFAPTADEIWRIPKHSKDGYVSYDEANGLLSIMDTAHDAKPRPEIVTIYPGGKATNVARVLDRLLKDDIDLRVELVTFLPPPPEGPLQKERLFDLQKIPILPSTPAGIYVQCLQIAELRRVKPHFEVVPELKESGKMQTTRRCIEITLKEDNGSFNFSPRIIWSQRAAEAVKTRVTEVTGDSDMVVMAGAPPYWKTHPDKKLTPDSFYANIINSLKPDCLVSIDARGKYLYECLKGRKLPRFVFMNTDEFGDLTVALDELNKKSFSGTLLVHNERGCWVWDGSLPDGQDAFKTAEYFPSVPVSRIYSTIGAGDAMHAGFLKEWICSGGDLCRAVVYSQVVAAVSISNEKATHGIDNHSVENILRHVYRRLV